MSLLKQAADLLSGAEHLRGQVDLQVDLREWGDSNTSILEVGGRWDRELQRWVDTAKQRVVWRVQPAQYEAAYWFAGWFTAWMATPIGEPVKGYEDISNWQLMGGAGGGKSDLAVKAWGCVNVGKAGAVTFAASPTRDDHTELLGYCAAMWPAHWFRKPESEDVFYFANGSQPRFLSAYDPRKLKRGRTDFAVLNEAQKFKEEVYINIRRRLGDRSGLLCMPCNPASDEDGLWINDMHDQVIAGLRPTTQLHFFEWRKNPTINQRTQENLAVDLSPEDLARERDGEVRPLGDTVFPRWSMSPAPRGNVAPVPAMGDVTEWFTKLVLGRPFKQVIGLDFDKLAYQPAPVNRFYLDPEADPEADPTTTIRVLTYIVDYAMVEDGLEDDMVDALEQKKYDREATALVADASGEIQDMQRNPGRHSLDVYRKRGWTNIYLPDESARRNPDVSERLKVGRALICNSQMKRRLLSAPENYPVNTAFKKWPILNGGPHRKSKYAHWCDAETYLLYRFFAHYLRQAPAAPKTMETLRTVRPRRARDWRGL